MFKIEGLEKLSRDIDDAKNAMSAIDGDVGTVSFDPEDPSSIERAIVETEVMIDEKLGAYRSNPFVSSMIDDLKEKYRDGILHRAAEARLSAAGASSLEDTQVE